MARSRKFIWWKISVDRKMNIWLSSSTDKAWRLEKRQLSTTSLIYHCAKLYSPTKRSTGRCSIPFLHSQASISKSKTRPWVNLNYLKKKALILKAKIYKLRSTTMSILIWAVQHSSCLSAPPHIGTLISVRSQWKVKHCQTSFHIPSDSHNSTCVTLVKLRKSIVLSLSWIIRNSFLSSKISILRSTCSQPSAAILLSSRYC